MMTSYLCILHNFNHRALRMFILVAAKVAISRFMRIFA
jgi:hypothetical protein